MKGKVYLVGAGPGDPDLLTLKALRLLQSADAVLHDDLVSPAILKLISPAAQVHNVGKRSGVKKITQEESNFLITSLAALGLTVVRLKSGDPLIFGRAGEEIEALRRSNIDYEIVPGVTAAFGAAAAAGIPLTHRQASHAVVLLTGQVAAGIREVDWQKFVSSGATLVIYMPHELGKIASQLKRAGLENEMPIAIVSRATTADEQVHVTTLANLPSHKPCAPSLLIVGEVVRLAESSVLSTWEHSANKVPLVAMQVLLGRTAFTKRGEVR
jgi:uroporphyrin-III C-methyltransferase